MNIYIRLTTLRIKIKIKNIYIYIQSPHLKVFNIFVLKVKIWTILSTYFF